MNYSLPHTIENHLGEKLIFKGISHEPDGDVLVSENFVQPGSGPPMHVGKLGEEHVQIGWAGAPTGIYAWTEGTAVHCLYTNGPKFSRMHMYLKEVSGGTLRVNSEHPTWVVGTFTLTKSGWYDLSPYPPSYGTSSIKGVFRVKYIK